jgi:hypothetical protein
VSYVSSKDVTNEYLFVSPRFLEELFLILDEYTKDWFLDFSLEVNATGDQN